MSKKYLDINLKLVIILSCTLVVLSCCLIPLFLIGYSHIVIGINIGIACNCLYYLGNYFVNKIKSPKLNFKLTLTLMIARFVLIAALLVIFGILEHIHHICIANVFGIVGGYTLSVIIHVIVANVLRGKNG